MVVLVIGGAGQLGQAIQFIAAEYPDVDFVFADVAEADITNPLQLEQLFEKVKPDFCINAAAYTSVDKAETESELAELVNVEGAMNLAIICQESSTTLIHISTDFVFDGSQSLPYTEKSVTNPQSIYGITKRDGEEAIKAILSSHFIIRTSWLYSQFANNFMKTMLKLASERTELKVVNDQKGTPTNAVDLAHAIIKIISSGSKAFGTYHFSNEGEATWYEFAREIFKVNNCKINLVPIISAEFPTAAKRPIYSVLDKSKIKNTFGIEILPWQESLRRITPQS